VSHISKIHNENLKNIQQKFQLRVSHSMDIMNNHFTELEKQKEMKMQQSKEKEFPKFERHYYYKMKIKKKHLEKEEIKKERIEILNENKKNIENEKR